MERQRGRPASAFRRGGRGRDPVDRLLPGRLLPVQHHGHGLPGGLHEPGEVLGGLRRRRRLPHGRVQA
eukprot:11218902-Lingulodinium_polyedra.AAC.1